MADGQTSSQDREKQCGMAYVCHADLLLISEQWNVVNRAEGFDTLVLGGVGFSQVDTDLPHCPKRTVNRKDVCRGLIGLQGSSNWSVFYGREIYDETILFIDLNFDIFIPKVFRLINCLPDIVTCFMYRTFNLFLQRS